MSETSYFMCGLLVCPLVEICVILGLRDDKFCVEGLNVNN